MLILITNDDGIHAPGLAALRAGLSDLARVVVVAPDRERSATSHSLTIHQPLRVREIEKDFYSVDGTPADCVHLAVNVVLRDTRPDLVVSGINDGGNIGDDVIYSGTVAGAREAALQGIQSFAISVAAKSEHHFGLAARFAHRVARYLYASPLPERILLNVNIPDVPPGVVPDYRFARLGTRVYSGDILQHADPRGQHYYWIGGREIGYTEVENSDMEVMAKGFISVTPLQLDTTHDRLMAALRDGPGFPEP
ncbi:5'/3'-nucleotidase SurE [bacterium]|nr:5'/3'-nucleotidase SurE [bacterium]